MADPKSRAKKEPEKARLNLIGLRQDDERPALRVYAVDRNRKALAAALVGEDGAFDLPERALKDAHRIIIGPETDDLAGLDQSQLLVYRPAEFAQLPQLTIPERIWRGWYFWWRCVSGSVRACKLLPPFIRDLKLKANLVDTALRVPLTANRALSLKATAVDNLRAAFQPSLTIFPPISCAPVCTGRVEVYRRVCCCEPVIVFDPRIPDIIEELEKFPVPPPPPWPPIPEPDPAPFRELPFFREGALDERLLNARRDLHMLRTLSPQAVVEYINARPYLLCIHKCGDPVKVAEGTINPNGQFNVCWKEFPLLLKAGCKHEYAYVVKQQFGPLWLTIYNGLAANQWFDYDDEANLVSFSPLARTCRDNDFPGVEGAFVLLEQIGDADSYRLQTPNAAGWDRVAGPFAYNDGLADTVANPADALGQYKNRNWGGSLKLSYHFSEPMRALGARFYRISVTAADSSGNPTGVRTYLSAGLSWDRYTSGGDVEPVSLGPSTVNGETNLYTIPFDADSPWKGNQYHGVVNTTAFNNGRFLVTLEVFDQDGKLLRPTGTAAPAGSYAASSSAEAGFTFRRWFKQALPNNTFAVSQAALTHLFWWDNRNAEADIVDLRQNTVESTAECQFLEGPGSDTFSVGYRAYHPEPMFLLDHSLWWKRGLNGPTRHLVNKSPYNVSASGAPVGVSPAHTFDYMLGEGVPGTLTKCTFALHLHANSKTFDGEGTLDRDASETASFALEIN